VTVLRITSELHDWPLLRVTVAPNAENGLRKPAAAAASDWRRASAAKARRSRHAT
jgi:hypothetical protein